MEQVLIHNAQTYAERHRLKLSRRLGFGIHGIIFATEGNSKSADNSAAIKAHRHAEPFHRELAVYERLGDGGITKLLGFNIPQLLDFDAELLVIKMTIVSRPFVLDFAGAYLDLPPEFSEAIWEEWEIEKMEQFGPHWPQAKAVLAA